MSFKEFRKSTGLTQMKFADYFEIPLGTLQAWERERHSPPSYVLKLMIKVWDYEQGKRIEDAAKRFIENIVNG